MQKLERVYLCGLGAVGGSYAAMFERWKPSSIRVLADQQRVERYRENRIFVNRTPVNFSFLCPGETAPAADLILIAVKRNQLDEAIEVVRPFVGDGSVILSLLNGVDSEDRIAAHFGAEKVLHSFVVGTDATKEGNKIVYSKLGTIVFGERGATDSSDRVRGICRLFEDIGIPYRVPLDIIRELWWKFMMNVGINQTSAVLHAPYGVYQRSSEARELMRLACGEVVDLAERLHIGLRREDIEEYFAIIQELSPEGKTSMLQDIERGRETEVEAFAGTVIRLGRAHNVSTPVNQMLYLMIKVLEQQTR